MSTHHNSRASGPRMECPGGDFARVVGWLVEIGFPFDFSTTIPVPRCLRLPLAIAWAARDGESVESYLWAIDEEVGDRWAA